jgi:hypothetical protein
MSAETLMNRNRWLAREAAVLIGVMQLTVLTAAGSPAHAAPAAPAVPAAPPARCDVRLRVELTPDVANPSDARTLTSLLRDHPGYRLSLRGQDMLNASVIMVDLTGPGPSDGCRAVVEAMRKDRRIFTVDVQRRSPALRGAD